VCCCLKNNDDFSLRLRASVLKSFYVFIFKLKLSCKIRIISQLVMAACTGPLATINRKLRQARKGATVAVTSGAGVWLV